MDPIGYVDLSIFLEHREQWLSFKDGTEDRSFKSFFWHKWILLSIFNKGMIIIVKYNILVFCKFLLGDFHQSCCVPCKQNRLSFISIYQPFLRCPLGLRAHCQRTENVWSVVHTLCIVRLMLTFSNHRHWLSPG